MYRIFAVAVFVAALIVLPVMSMAGGDTPTIHVVSPNGGERWPVGSTQTISWEDTGPAPGFTDYQVSIHLISIPDNLNETALGYPIYDARRPGKDYGLPVASYRWQVPADIQPDGYRVRISIYRLVPEDPSVEIVASDESDTPFSIIAGGITEPPVPAEPIVWLEDVVLRTQQNQASAGLHIEIEGIISVEMNISTQVLAPVTGAVLNPMLSDWALVRRLDEKGTLHIAAAGATPAPTDNPVLWLVFDTSQMLPGDWFLLLPAISWNEGPWTNIVGRVAFLPIAGDVTVDGEVTAFDGVRVLQYSVGLATAANALGLIPAVADVSGNGTISSYDAGLIFRFVAGLITLFPVQVKDYGVAGEIASTTTVAGKPVASEPAKVWLGRATESADGSYAIPVVIDQMDGVLAGQLEIGPVPDGVSVEPTKLLEGYQIVTNQRNGKLLVSFAGASSPQGGGEMFRLKFATRPARLTAKVQINEDPTVTLSTAVEQTSWGRIKAGFLGR